MNHDFWYGSARKALSPYVFRCQNPLAAFYLLGTETIRANIKAGSLWYIAVPSRGPRVIKDPGPLGLHQKLPAAHAANKLFCRGLGVGFQNVAG